MLYAHFWFFQKNAIFVGYEFLELDSQYANTRSSCNIFMYFCSNKRPSDEKDDEDKSDDEFQKTKRRKLSEYPEILRKQFDDYTPFRNNTIQKWNDRTKIASGKYAKSNFSAFDQPILKQIEDIMSDKQRLIERTFVRRSHYRVIGEEDEEEVA